NTRHGIRFDGTTVSDVIREWNVIGPVCIDNDSGDSDTYDGIAFDGSNTMSRNVVVGAVCRTSSGNSKQRYGISFGAGATSNSMWGCMLFGNKTGPVGDSGTNNAFDGNGLNEDVGDASATLTPSSSPTVNIWDTALTQDR